MQMPSSNRREILALLFADIVGYTSLMGSEENKALQARKSFRHTFKEVVPQFDGSVIEFYGDGVLCTFKSAVKGCHAALESLSILKKHNLDIRYGIHVADVIIQDDGVIGDGVNVASRIESLAVPNSILISEKVHDEIKNHPDIPVKDLGSFEFKNIKKSLMVYALDLPQLSVPDPLSLEGKTSDKFRSIAVLPFVNMSGDEDNEYFSDGITEEIINALARISGLKITSRTSSFAFKDRKEDIKEIGKQLKVNTIMEGSVRKAGNRVRISAQLIDVANGYHHWSEVYDRALEDIFAVQDEIASKISERFSSHLYTHKKKLVDKPTENMEAYNEFLQGLYFWNKYTPQNINKAIKHLETAISLEPKFVYPYAYISFCYLYSANTGQIKPSIGLEKSALYVKKAKELDPNYVGTLIASGMYHLLQVWDFATAKKELEHALRLYPGNAELLNYYGLYNATIGNMELAIDNAEEAAKLDPLSLPIRLNLGNMYLFSRRYGDALQTFNKILELDPAFRNAIEAKGWTYYLMENYKKSEDFFFQFQKLTDSPLKGWTSLGFIYGRQGKKKLAGECIDKILQRQKESPEVNLDLDLAVIYYGMEEYDSMYYYLEKAFANKMGILFLRANPIFKKLQEQQRFQELLIKNGFKYSEVQ